MFHFHKWEQVEQREGRARLLNSAKQPYGDYYASYMILERCSKCKKERAYVIGPDSSIIDIPVFRFHENAPKFLALN